MAMVNTQSETDHGSDTGLASSATSASVVPRLVTGLWGVWAVLLAVGLAADVAERPGLSEIGRLGSSVILVLAGWAWAHACRSSAASVYAMRIALGMTCGAMGDFFMAGRLSMIPLPNPVLGGMASFGLGHILYIAACLRARRDAGLMSNRAMGMSVVIWQAFSAAGWYVVVWPSGDESTQMLIWPALAYSALLAGTAGVATGLAVQDRRFCLLSIGAGLFLISDLVLAWALFRGTFPYRTLAVWSCYGVGQMLIVYAPLTARSAFSVPRSLRD